MTLDRFGSYEVLEVLGEGASGTVYRARDGAGREVALKLVNEELADDAEVEYRFRREMRIARTLDHPNLVRTFDAGTGDGRQYLACELVKGGTLADRVPLDENTTVGVMRDLLAALDAVFQAGLVHRDVKPANILLTDTGAAKLSDLGLARSTAADRTQFTQEGMVIGSPAYLAPEQVEGGTDLDIRCDLYAAGIVLYECLTGAPPFQAESPLEIMWARVDGPPPSLREVEPGVDPALADLCDALLAKEREDRPATPRDALARLPATEFPATLDERVAFPATMAEGGAVFGSAVSDATVERERAAAELRPAPTTPPVELQPVGADPPLGRARLTRGGRTLFVYTGSRLQMGRDGLERSDQDVCLRLYPAAEHEEQIRRISRAHLRLMVQARTQSARVVDLETKTGTRLNGQPVPPGSPRLLEARNDVDVAGVLRLDVQVVAAPTSAPPAVAGAGAPDAAAPALFVRRPENGSDFLYALVPGRLILHDLEPTTRAAPRSSRSTAACGCARARRAGRSATVRSSTACA